MRVAGLLLIFAALAAPIPWFISLTSQRDAIAVLSQFLGSEALILMGVSQFLATRMRWMEVIFGSLDRIYVLHKWLGIGAMAAVLLHDTIDAEMDGLGAETFIVELAETFGEISLYGLLILVTLTVATFVPYHLWRWTHKFIGAFFALAAIHYAFILKPFDLSDPVGLYVLAFCVLGVLSYFYTLALHGALRGAASYKVTAVDQAGDATAVTLAPIGRSIRAKPGQFAFIRFDVPGLGEVHPFTLSQAPDESGKLRFTIKPLGDFTSRIVTALEVGISANVTGGHGHFQRRKNVIGEI